MRIALTQKKKTWGGQTLRVWDLALALRDRGHEVFLIAQSGTDFVRRAQEAGFPLLEMRMDGLARPGDILRMARFLRHNRVELVHCHDPREHVLSCLARPLAGVRALVRTKCNMLPLRNAFSRYLHGPLTSRLMSISEAVKGVLVECGMNPDRITTVYNYIDYERFRPGPASARLRRSLGIGEQSPVVGNIGRLHVAKGIEDMIRAVPAVSAAVPEARFLFVGSRHEQWLPLVRELSVEDCCIFTGRVPNEDVPDYLRLLDVFVFPTHREALGRAALEAMAARRAIVATAVGGLKEVVEDGVTGILIEPHRPDQIAGAIVRLLKDPALRERLAAAACRNVAEKFTRKQYLDSIERVYRQALNS